MVERSAKGRHRLRCAIYTRKSSEEGLEQQFNSLDAQREACEAFIASQRHEGWMVVRNRYDDGGFSGGTMGGLHFSSSWPISRRAGSTSWSSIRLIV